MAEHLDPATARAAVARSRSRGQEAAPSTPPTAGLAAVQYASDPESARVSGRSRGRRLGIRVGRRRSAAQATSRERAGVAGGYGDDAAAAGSGSHRRLSAGSRFGAMLRRGAPSLHHLRRSSSSGGGKNVESKPHPATSSRMHGTDFLPLPAPSMSPPLQLDDPPEGHLDLYDDDGTRGARAVTSSNADGGRRRFTRSKSALGSSGRHLGRYEADGNGGSLHDDSFPGGGGGGSRGQRGARPGVGDGDGVFVAETSDGVNFTVLARNAHDGDDGYCGGRAAYWSGSDLDGSGGRRGDEGERYGQPSAESVRANGGGIEKARDRSAPPPRRALLPGEDAAKTRYGETGYKEEGRSSVVRIKDGGKTRGGPDGEGRHTVDGSSGSYSSARREASGWKSKKSGRRIVDGYMSAPDDLLHRENGIGRGVGPRGVTLEMDECIARAEAALFSTDTTSDAEIDAGGGGSGGGSSDGDGDEAGVTATAAAAHVAARSGGKHGTISKRRRLTGLLNFRRRSGSSSVAGNSSLSSSAPGPTDDNGTTHNGVNRASSGRGKSAARRGPSSSTAAPHRRGALNRSNSTSALDRVGSRYPDGEDGAAMTTTAAAAAREAPSAAGRKGTGTKRRLLPGGSSTSSSSTAAAAAAAAGSGRGASVSPEKYRRHRDSFLEAGKDKLRRGRSKLSRGTFGGRSSSQRRHRAAPPEVDPWEGSQDGEKSGQGEEEEGEEEEGGGGGPAGERGRREAQSLLQPSEEGPPGNPQLGTTYTKRPGSTSPDESTAGTPWNTWGPGDASKFSVRTKGYGRSKVKAPSAPELYELASIDVYRSPAGRICGVYPMFAPPACVPRASAAATATAKAGSPADRTGGDNTATGGAGGGGHGAPVERPKTGGSPLQGSQSGGCGGDVGGGTGHPDIPPVLVVNCQLPDVPTPFSVQGDGPTIHVIFTFRATPRLCDYAARVWAEEKLNEAGDRGGGGGGGGRSSSSEVTPGGGHASPAAASEATPPAVSPAGTPAGDAVVAVPGTGAGLSADAGEAAACGGGGGGGSLLQQPSSGGSRAAVPGGGEPGGPDSGQQGGKREGDYGEVPESVRLLVEWMRRAEHDGGFRGRFKAIGDIVNADEVGLPSIAKRFSGKPILLYGKESSMVKGPGFAELDLNAHAFSYVGRKGLYITLDKWKRAIFRIGFLLEGRADEEQPEHMLGCGVFYGLDIYSLNELSLSPDGERLIVTNPADEGNTATAANDASNTTNGSQIRGASSTEAAAAEPISPPSLSAPHPGPSQARSANFASARFSSSSDAVPLIPRRHMESLLRQHDSLARGGGRIGGGDAESAAVVSPEKPACFFDDYENDDDEDEDVTITAVAAAAFAGGWFCALLAMVTIACWSELTTGTAAAEGEEGRSRAGFGAWLVRIFMDH